MAKQVETFEVKLEIGDLNKKAEQSAGLLEKLKNKQKEVKKEFGAGSAEYRNVSEQLRQTNRIYRETNKAIDDNVRASKAAKGSIQQQRSELSRLTKKWKEQGTETKAGKKKQQELGKQVRKLTDDLKKQESAVGQNQRNVGNYKDALDNLSPGLSGATTAIWAMVKAAAAFVATPLGLVLSGIAAVIAPVIAYFTKTKSGVEQVERASATLSATFDVLIDRLSSVGEALKLIFTGDFQEGIDKMKESFAGVADEIEREATAAYALQAAMQILTDAEREYSVEKAKQRKTIEQLKLIAEDQSRLDQERLEAAKEANRIELEIQNKSVDLAKERVRITHERINLGESLKEDLDDLAEAEIALANVEAESLTKRIELNNKYNALVKSIEDQKKKSAEEESKRQQKLAEEEQKILDEQLAKRQEFETAIRDAKQTTEEREIQAVKDKYLKLEELAIEAGLKDQELASTQLELKRLREEEITRIIQDNEEQRTETAKSEAQKQKQIEQALQTARQSLLLQTATSARQLAKEGTAEYKVAATAENIIATYLGATQAFQQGVSAFPPPVGPILGAAGAALMIATGVANQSQILKARRGAVVKAARGRMVSGEDATKHYDIGGNLHSEGGTTFYDANGVPQFEAERGEMAVIMKRDASDAIRRYSDLNQSFGGVGFMRNGGVPKMADGGIAIGAASSPIVAQENINRLTDAIGKMNIWVSVLDIESAQQRVRVAETQAQSQL